MCVCFSNIDSAFFECLPWSTGAVCEPASVPFPVLKTLLQSNLYSSLKCVFKFYLLIADDWIGMDQSCSSEPIRGEGGILVGWRLQW